MRDTASFRNEDLVLRLGKSINPATFDIGRFEAFLDALCTNREFQKDAIRTVCNFLFGGAYTSTRTLAEENWNANPVLRDKYPDFARMERALEIPGKLACSVDLATGTGKSYVMYGIARIALAAGVVDRVLVLCPSNTIEAGLTDKFRALSEEAELTALLPEDAAILTPHIANASASITAGTICIENIHATYKATKSAIDDSLKGKGDRTLILNDEAHHIYTPERDAALKKWMEFLVSEDFGFRFIAGFSGTCYVGNEYFVDVVSRYSLRKAIEDGVVKSIDYVVEDAPGDAYEKWQKIHKNHKDAKAKYRKLRPLTMIVMADIPSCKKVTDELIDFLAQQEGITRDDAARKVMRVHTPRSTKEDKEVARSIAALREGEPDSKDSAVEWITSVSMLTEGWDVHNVFQIYPHEKRAFDSKLLIAQVLGRGLRVPEPYRGDRPLVTVYNHDKWSGQIRGLVNEVLEIEKKIVSFAVSKSPDSYHFDIHQIDYARAEELVATEQTEEYNFDMEMVQLATQSRELTRETEYESAVTGLRKTRKTRVRLAMVPIEKVALDVSNKFQAIDLEEGTSYADRYPVERIRQLIRKSLENIGYGGNEVSKENRQRILSAFGNLKRPGNKSIRYRTEPGLVRKIRTSDRPKDSIGISALRHGGCVFYDELTKAFDADLSAAIVEVEEDMTAPKGALFELKNRFHFKTGFCTTLTSSRPEFTFVKGLCAEENAAKITAWAKNVDSGFYEIEYSFSKGDYSKRAKFNPDFFILLDGLLVVVEVKGDEEIADPSQESRGKRREALRHFDLLNQLQAEVRYHFCFVTPKDYDVFFDQLRQGKVASFQSSLDVALMSGAEK